MRARSFGSRRARSSSELVDLLDLGAAFGLGLGLGLGVGFGGILPVPLATFGAGALGASAVGAGAVGAGALGAAAVGLGFGFGFGVAISCGRTPKGRGANDAARLPRGLLRTVGWP